MTLSDILNLTFLQSSTRIITIWRISRDVRRMTILPSHVEQSRYYTIWTYCSMEIQLSDLFFPFQLSVRRTRAVHFKILIWQCFDRHQWSGIFSHELLPYVIEIYSFLSWTSIYTTWQSIITKVWKKEYRWRFLYNVEIKEDRTFSVRNHTVIIA